MEDGKVMACGGVAFLTDTTGVAWMRMSRLCKGKPFRWARSIKVAFKLALETLDDMDIYTYIIDGFCAGDRIARSCGLKMTDEYEEHNGNRYYKYVVK